MPSLLEAQRAFAQELLAAERPAGAGMQAYRANVWGNWSGALVAAFPIVRKIVGAEFFEALAREYARAHPSSSGDLNTYGAELPAFVAGFADTQDLPYLADVARMEWLAQVAYYGAEPAVFEMKGDPARWRLALTPASALLASDWPLARIWEIHQDDYHGEFVIDLHSGGERILIYRPRWRVEVCALGEGDWHFLVAAKRGARLEDALAAAASDPNLDVANTPARWLAAGAITVGEAR